MNDYFAWHTPDEKPTRNWVVGIYETKKGNVYNFIKWDKVKEEWICGNHRAVKVLKWRNSDPDF